MVYNLHFFFSSNCSLFHNSNVFGSCIIHILYTGCAKIKKIISEPKGYAVAVSSPSFCPHSVFIPVVRFLRSTLFRSLAIDRRSW